MTPLGSAPRRAERGEEEASTQQLTGGDLQAAAGGDVSGWRAAASQSDYHN